MGQNRYGGRNENVCRVEEEEAGMRIIKERAAALIVAVHEHQTRHLEFHMGLSFGDVNLGHWHVAIERLDGYTVQ